MTSIANLATGNPDSLTWTTDTPNEATITHGLTYRDSVDLPVMPPILPMLAKPASLEKVLSMAPNVQLEPKRDHLRSA